MKPEILFLPILIPLVAGLLALVFSKVRFLKEILSFMATLLNLTLACLLFGSNITYTIPWAGFGMDFSLRLYHFSSFIIASAAAIGFLIGLYSIIYMQGKKSLGQFYAYFLITLSMVNGAVLSNNLVLFVFFCEGSLLTLFGLIIIGRKEAFSTAIKAFTIVGISDLCMMLGIALTGYIAGTLTLSEIHLSLTPLASLAFILMMIGTIAKSGSMPFHSWIPDAALDAPLPFMALVPAALEKLLGIYFLTRICLDLFKLVAGSWLSFLLMAIGSVTILLAVMMALIQKDFKKLLSYHAISQVGYMILGIGTAVPAGIIGGLFHMLNNAMYKSCLFLTGGSVERQTGTTSLEKLGGLGKKMPITFLCFFIAAVSISGVPPFNGFFSKELVYDGALERGWIFYAAALLGSFFTAASFLKLGHAAFLGPLREENKNVKEVPFLMLLPMIIIAVFCVLFGLYNIWPIHHLIQPILGERAQGHHFGGMPENIKLVIATLIVLVGAILNHLWGFKSKGSGLKAVDHIHYAPVLSTIYDKAEKRFFDPYDIGWKIALFISKITWFLDRSIDWIYNVFSVEMARTFTQEIKKAHNGNYALYLGWSMIGTVFVILFFIYTK